MLTRKFSSINDVEPCLSHLPLTDMTFTLKLDCWEIEIMPASLIENWLEDKVPFPIDDSTYIVSIWEWNRYGKGAVWISSHKDFENFSIQSNDNWKNNYAYDLNFKELLELIYYVDRLVGLKVFK